QFQPKLGSCLAHFAVPEYVMLFATVGTGEIGHVLHQPDYWNVHLLGHLDGFGHDHSYQLLGGGHYENAIHRYGLEHGQGYITGPWRHIDEHVIDVRPEHIGPKLFDRSRQDGPAP